MGRIIPLLSLSLAEFLIFYILSSYNSLGWLLETLFSRKWCYNSSWFHPCPPTLVHFSENTPITGSAFTIVLWKLHKDLARVGGGLGLALVALGVPTDPVGRLSGIFPEAFGHIFWWSPEADTRNHVPLMCFDILIRFLCLLFPPLRNGGATSVLWMLRKRSGFL